MPCYPEPRKTSYTAEEWTPEMKRQKMQPMCPTCKTRSLLPENFCIQCGPMGGVNASSS